MVMRSKLPRTFFPKAHSVETFRTFDGGEGQQIHHDGLLAEVLRVKGLQTQKAGEGWAAVTKPYDAAVEPLDIRRRVVR